MRRTLAALLAATVLVVHAPAARAEDLVYTRFGEFLEALRVQLGIPGMVAAVVGRNEVQWERVFGYADVEKKIPTRIDTPFVIDGLTESLSASLLLRCAEEGKVELTDVLAPPPPPPIPGPDDVPEPPLTIHEILTHTSGPAENPVYQYRPDRLNRLAPVLTGCSSASLPDTFSKMFEMSGMYDSVPSAAVSAPLPVLPGAPLALQQEAQAAAARFERYKSILLRLATPYAYDATTKKTAVGAYSPLPLTPTSAVISTVQDLEKFDLMLKNGILVTQETQAVAQRAPVSATGQRLPHALGWFAQNYLGENVYWQFGSSDQGGSALMVVWPTRSLTFILLANSNGLTKPFNLEAGDLRTSPVGKLFLQLFIR